jgi:excisionase family DNA binding protein
MSDMFLLTAEELADKLRVHASEVLKLTKDGKLPYVTVAGQYRYRWSDVKAKGVVNAD